MCLWKIWISFSEKVVTISAPDIQYLINFSHKGERIRLDMHLVEAYLAGLDAYSPEMIRLTVLAGFLQNGSRMRRFVEIMMRMKMKCKMLKRMRVKSMR